MYPISAISILLYVVRELFSIIIHIKEEEEESNFNIRAKKTEGYNCKTRRIIELADLSLN